MASPSAEATASATSDLGGWTKVTTPAALALANVSQVVIGPNQIVAVGQQQSAGGQPFQAAGWSSPDGKSWSKASIESAEQSEMVAAATHNGGYAAVGLTGVDVGGGSAGDAVLWWSGDGASWTLAQHGQTGFHVAAGAEIAGIVDGPAGLIAAANSCSGSGAAAACETSIWRSSDGLTWSAQEPRPDLTKGAQWLRLRSLSSHGGQYLLVGVRCQIETKVHEHHDCAIVAWGSGDGVTWTESVSPVAPANLMPDIEDTAQNPADQLLADGYIEQQQCESDNCGVTEVDKPVWQLDGASWSTLSPTYEGVDPATFYRVGSLAATASNWYRLPGFVRGNGGGLYQRLLRSSDGAHWTLVDGFDPNVELPYDFVIGERLGLVIADDHAVGEGAVSVWLIDPAVLDGN